MEWQDVLAQLVEFVENAAPMVWAIARRQVVVSIAEHILWFLGVGGFAWWGIRLGKKWRKSFVADEILDTPEGFAVMLAVIFAYIAVPVAFGLLIAIISRLVNPDFYAIQLLLNFAR